MTGPIRTEKIHTENEDAFVEFQESLMKAAGTEHWMGCVWCVVNGEMKLLKKTTFGFLRGNYPSALDQLKELIDEDTDESDLPIPPLPRADFPRVHKAPPIVSRDSGLILPPSARTAPSPDNGAVEEVSPPVRQDTPQEEIIEIDEDGIVHSKEEEK